MYKNTKNTKTLISEMKTMLNNKPGKKGLLEGLVYGEDEENMMGPEMEQPSELSKEKQGVPTSEITETNPLDEDPEITKLITNIRVQTLTGLQKLAEHPECSQYELLKKIFLLIDKAVEDKMDVEK
mgnify:CR=1 FL=1